jgi:hypothetical protein
MPAKHARVQNFAILAGMLLLLLSSFFIGVFMQFENSAAQKRMELARPFHFH